jgi:hypothetical protein
MKDQLKSVRGTLAAIYVPTVAILVIACVQKRAPLDVLMRDTLAQVDLPFYTGAISNLGVLLWCAAAAVCLFTWWVLGRRSGDSRTRRSLLWAGLLTVLLNVDDFYQLHEYASIHSGLPDEVFTSVYPILLAAWLFFFWREIRKTEYILLFLALALLGTSVFVDALDGMFKIKFNPTLLALTGHRYHLLEDGPKFLGIATWLGYFWRSCWLAIATTFPERSGSPSGLRRGAQRIRIGRARGRRRPSRSPSTTLQKDAAIES